MASTSIDLNMLLVMLHSRELYTVIGVIFVYQTEEWNMLFKNRLNHKTNYIALSVKKQCGGAVALCVALELFSLVGACYF